MQHHTCKIKRVAIDASFINESDNFRALHLGSQKVFISPQWTFWYQLFVAHGWEHCSPPSYRSISGSGSVQFPEWYVYI